MHTLKLFSQGAFCTDNKSNALIYLNIDTTNSMNGDVDLIVSLRFSCHYQCKTRLEKKVLKYAQEIQSIFNRSDQSYGTRRIRKALSNQGIIVSRRYVAKVMKTLSLKSKYTAKR